MRLHLAKYCGILVAALAVANPVYAQLAAGSGPISGYHNNPSNCTSCHNAAAYTATATLSGPASVLHDQNSTAFTLSGTGGLRRGFNIAIYRVSGNAKISTGYNNLSAGIYTPFDNGELQHGVAQTATSWTFQWTAPTTLGSYRVYACVNPVNNSGDDLGDGTAACDTFDFSVTNTNPNADDDLVAIVVGEDAAGYSANVDVLSNDDQTESDAFSWFADNQAGLTGDLDHVSNGVYRYRPNGQFEFLDSGESATTSFTYSIREDGYLSYTDTATVTIRIDGANDAPVAIQDGSSGLGNGHVSINEGATASNVGTVLSNDTDVDIETLSAYRNGPGVPANCDDIVPSEKTAFTLNTNGSFSYTHDGSEPVQDSFSYCAYDGTSYSAPQTVYVDIAAINDPPTISGFTGSTAFIEQTPVVIDNSVNINDSDSTMINRARLTISNNYEAGDTLSCASSPPAGIFCGSFDLPSRTLTLSGVSTWVNYQIAISTVEFDNSSDNPGLSTRTIDLDVRDDPELGTSLDVQKTITIARRNDPPTIASIANQSSFEDTLADPSTFTYTAVASDVDSDDDFNDGGGSLTYSLSGAPPWMSISNSNPSHGQISGNPPQTGVFGQVYGPITVLIEDGDEDGSAPNSVSFSLTVDPPDDDSDGVANYNDLCLTVTDASNADNDGDGTPGSDGGANDGGDVCDLDDDNDGISDIDEVANFFDPFDASDAAEDADGDGLSNLFEITNGSNPWFADLVIDATGYLTAYTLPMPLPVSVHPQATTATASDYGPYRPGRHIITWTGANSVNAALGTSDQTFDLRPLINFAADQQVEEGSAVMVDVIINGDAPVFPVTVDYSISGNATLGVDYSAPSPVSGSLVFNDAMPQTISFNTVAGDGIDPNETVLLTLDSATNAAIGSNASHRVTLIENNLAPTVGLQFTQGGDLLGATYAGDGAIDIDALVNDVNVGQSHNYDWSGTDNALLPPGDVASWQIAVPSVGNYLVDVLVSDDGLPSQSTRVTRILNVSAGSAPALSAIDSDGDGRDDNDVLEGYADDDGDGIPNYLDANSDSAVDANLFPDQTVNRSNSVLLSTDPGLRMARGDTAEAANNFGALLTDSDITQFGSVSGTAPTAATDSYDHIGGVYDFEVRGLIPGASVRVVIPLLSGIPKDAEYRKFNPVTGWSSFVVDSGNGLASAPGALGACPEPGSGLYQSGLNYLDNCLEIRIQDGGANDSDNLVNGIVADPGTIGVRLSEPEIEAVEAGGGQMSPLMLTLLLSLIGFFGWRRADATT